MAKLLNVRVTSKHSIRHHFIVQCSILDNTRKFEKHGLVLLFRNTNITTNSFVSVASPMRLVDIVRENRPVLKFNNKQNIDKGLEQYVITAQQFICDVSEASKISENFWFWRCCFSLSNFHHHSSPVSSPYFHHFFSSPFITSFSSPFITNSSW